VRRIHFLVGLATVIVFLGTGVYMRMNFPALYINDIVIRYMFRANHVYLLFSGLINIVLGLSVSHSNVIWKRRLQTIGSWILLSAPALFLAAFFIEPPQATPSRPITLLAVFLSLLGVIAHTIGGNAHLGRKDNTRETI